MFVSHIFHTYEGLKKVKRKTSDFCASMKERLKKYSSKSSAERVCETFPFDITHPHFTTEEAACAQQALLLAIKSIQCHRPPSQNKQYIITHAVFDTNHVKYPERLPYENYASIPLLISCITACIGGFVAHSQRAPFPIFATSALAPLLTSYATSKKIINRLRQKKLLAEMMALNIIIPETSGTIPEFSQ